MTKMPNMFRELENSNFDSVSDFVLRILNLDVLLRTISSGVIFTN